jgi:hypothetical protein
MKQDQEEDELEGGTSSLLSVLQSVRFQSQHGSLPSSGFTYSSRVADNMSQELTACPIGKEIK